LSVILIKFYVMLCYVMLCYAMLRLTSSSNGLVTGVCILLRAAADCAPKCVCMYVQSNNHFL